MGLTRAAVRDWQLHPAGLLGHPDFLFPRSALAVFVDGCFWHGCPECGHLPRVRRPFWKAKIERNQARDKRTTAVLRRQGLAVLRLWEHEVQRDLTGCVRRVMKAVKARGQSARLFRRVFMGR